MLKWEKFLFNVILNRGISTYLKNKKYLILIVDKLIRKFNVLSKQYTAF